MQDPGWPSRLSCTIGVLTPGTFWGVWAWVQVQSWCCSSGAPEKPDEEETGAPVAVTRADKEFAGATGNTAMSARLAAALEPGEVLCCAPDAQAKL